MAKSKLFSFLALAGSAVFTFMLGMYAWAGTFARYWADDYCYSGTLREFGLIGGIANWYVESGNRFSTLIPVWISEWFGEAAIRWLPALILLLLVAGWFYALSGVARLARVTVRPVWIGLAALLLVYFNVLLAVDRLQSLYWRMGTLHYTLPLGAAVVCRRLDHPRAGFAPAQPKDWLAFGPGAVCFSGGGAFGDLCGGPGRVDASGRPAGLPVRFPRSFPCTALQRGPAGGLAVSHDCDDGLAFQRVAHGGHRPGARPVRIGADHPALCLRLHLLLLPRAAGSAGGLRGGDRRAGVPGVCGASAPRWGLEKRFYMRRWRPWRVLHFYAAPSRPVSMPAGSTPPGGP